jgi:hypothetical protein
MEITPTYVTFEQAKKLKEKGYPQLNKGLYYTKDKEHCLVGWGFNDRTENSFAQYSTPEQWQVLEWFRVNHGIWITIFIMEKEKIDGSGWECYYDYSIKQMKIGLINISKKLEEFNFPQEATSAAIDYVLNNLI